MMKSKTTITLSIAAIAAAALLFATGPITNKHQHTAGEAGMEAGVGTMVGTAAGVGTDTGGTAAGVGTDTGDE